MSWRSVRMVNEQGEFHVLNQVYSLKLEGQDAD